MDLKVGYVCDRGLSPKRPVNQDRFLSIPERGLFAVFDGVGGQRAGEVASQTAAETIEEAVTHNSTPPSLDLIKRAILFANRDVYELAESDPAYKTMATTVALIHIDGNRVTVAHVGDSRVYRLENGHFLRETVDHTDLNDAIRDGRIRPDDQVDGLPGGNVINRALGVESVVDVEIKTVQVRDGARFLLCSDGIYRHMSDDEIARVLAEHKDPQQAVDELKRIVHQRGADDNLTAVVVQLGKAKQTPIVSIDDGLPKARGKENRGIQTAQTGLSKTKSRGGRIHVDFNHDRSASGESARRLERAPEFQSDQSPTEAKGRRGSRTLMYTLLVLVLIAAAFYGGLRASDAIKTRVSNANANREADLLQTGREAFERGDFRIAAAEFDTVLKRDPSNSRAHYWMGRAQLEQREYESAVKSFEDAIVRQPALFDAYVQQAAAYEALGDKTKAAAALSRYAEERRKQPASAPQ